MEPLTTGAILTLAFQKFIEKSAGELAKKFTTEAIAKMDDLRKLIWTRLKGKHALAQEALAKAEKGDEVALNTVRTLLDVEMLDHSFAAEIRNLAQEINAGKLVDNSNMNQNNYGNARGWQTKVEGGTAYVGEIHQYDHDKPSSL